MAEKINWSLIQFPVLSRQRRKILNILRPLVDPTRYEKGCLECYLFETLDKTEPILFSTKWRNKDDLEQYLSSENFRTVLTAMDLCADKPEICFQETDYQQAIAYITEVRTRGFSD